MFLNKNSILVNNVSMGQYIVQAQFGYHKLWSDDSGRNLAGAMSGTLIGIFPKITLQFRRLTKTELETLATILDSENQTVSYYDPNKKAQTTMTTYTNDYNIINKRTVSDDRKNEGFSCAFISIRKRT